MELFNILTTIVLPVLAIAGVAYLLARTLAVEARTLSRVALYLLSPALAFVSFSQTQIPRGDLAQIALFVVVQAFVLWGVGIGVARLLRFDQATTSAFLLTALFMNAGNYGLPVTLFAFGQEGLDRAVIFFTVQALLTNSLAIYLASRSNQGRRQAILTAFKMPQPYAAALGLVFNLAGWTVPPPMLKSLKLMADAAVPVMLILLGVQLTKLTLDGDWREVMAAVVMRLGAAALLSAGVARTLGMTGLTEKVCILESSMPAAVATIAIAVEFNARPTYVTTVVFVSTLVSIVTITGLLAVLL